MKYYCPSHYEEIRPKIKRFTGCSGCAKDLADWRERKDKKRAARKAKLEAIAERKAAGIKTHIGRKPKED